VSGDYKRGLIGYWSFDEGDGTVVYDSSGNGNDGTIYGATWNGGYCNGGLQFNGTSDYIEIPDSVSLSPTSAITVEAWVKADFETVSSSGRAILAKGDTPSIAPDYVLAVSSSKQISFYISDSAGHAYPDPFPTTTYTIKTGKWYHIAGTYDGSMVKLYVNGKLEDQFPGSIALNDSDRPLYIGRWRAGDPAYWAGIIDEVKIYNRALTQEEIQADMWCK
jgi:hypothetical protein